MAAAACTAGTTGSAVPSRGPVGGTLRIGMTSATFWGMDPRDEWNFATWELFRCCLVRTLMSYDVSGTNADLRPIPDLASAPPEISTDGLTWTFRLRTGIHYAPPLDDVEITSGDFVRAITRAAATYDPVTHALPGYFQVIDGFLDYADGRASSIAGLQTPDPHTLRIVTTQLDSRLLYLLALPMSAPIPPLPGGTDAPFGVATGYEEDPEPTGGKDGYGRVLAASGPYMYEGADQVDYTLAPEERMPAVGFVPPKVHDDEFGNLIVDEFNSITLVRNPSWHPEDDPLRPALADRMEITGGEPEELFGMLDEGALDLVFDDQPPQPLLRRYQRDPELRPLISSPEGTAFIVFASFNVARPPFDDIAVRRAVAFAMDRLELAGYMLGPIGRGAEHFASDAFEASLLASWTGIPGEGHGDQAAAREAMRDSRYATGDRCSDPICDGVPILVRDVMEPGLDAFGDALRDLGIQPRFIVDPNPYGCLDPEAELAMCVGLGWGPDYPSPAQFVGSFFRSDGELAMTRLGASPAELRRWGYDVVQVPSVDDQIARCSRELGSRQAACWARLDQYMVTEVMAAVPLGESAVLRISTPALGPIEWDDVLLTPALERIAAPAADQIGPTATQT
jgi:hypothetical protein